jgi:hypothetical protein
MSKLINLVRHLGTLEILAGNALTDISSELGKIPCDHHQVLHAIHSEMFYALGLVGVYAIAANMEVVETPKGWRFKETPLTVYSEGTVTEYIHETLRQVAAITANEVIDDLFNVARLPEQCELFIMTLVEALEDMAEQE